MTTISQQYLEVTIVLLILSIIFYTLFSLYRKNEKLLSLNRALKEENQQLNETNLHYKIEHENLAGKLAKFEELQAIENKYYELLGEHSSLKEHHKRIEAELSVTKEQLKTLYEYKERVASLEELLESQKSIVKNMREEMTKEFKLLSSEVLEQKQESLQSSSQEQLKLLLEPFESELKSFQSRLEQLHTNQHNSLASLRGEILQIKSLNQTLANEASALTKALRGDSKVQGDWGELILERALEACGLREGVEYKREVNFKSEEGSLRPDVILYLPEQKHIVIDAKVSLSAYSKMVQAGSKEERERAQRAHIVSLKKHIDTLATKQYHMLNKLQAPEFTLMFIPIEAAYLAAIEFDSNLFEYAFERKVAVVTPTTLLTTLKTVSTLWKLANHDKNMQKLASEAALMHDKFALFLEEFLVVEQRLVQAQNAYDSAKQRLVNGQGSLFSKIKRVGNLSAKTKKSLPSIEEDAKS